MQSAMYTRLELIENAKTNKSAWFLYKAIKNSNRRICYYSVGIKGCFITFLNICRMFSRISISANKCVPTL